MSDIVPEPPRLHGGKRPLLVASVVAGVAAVAVVAFLVGRSSDNSGEVELDERAAAVSDREKAESGSTTTTTDADGAGSDTTSTTNPAAQSTAVSVPTDDLAAAERVAEQFIAALQGRDCDGLLALMSANTVAWLNASEEDGKPGRDQLCSSLATEEIPPMQVRTRAKRVEGGAVVELESGEEVEPLLLVLEARTWKVDLLGTGQRAAEEETSSTKQSDLRNGLTAEKSFYTDEQRYTDDVRALAAIEPSLEWMAGVVGDGADPDVVFVAVADGGQVVCLSGVDLRSVRYMIKDSPRHGVTYSKGDGTPRHCDAAPLAPSW